MVTMALAGQVVEEKLHGPKGYHGDSDDQALIQVLARQYIAKVERGRILTASSVQRLRGVYLRQPDRVRLIISSLRFAPFSSINARTRQPTAVYNPCRSRKDNTK
jgi:IS5 family transposase